MVHCVQTDTTKIVYYASGQKSTYCSALASYDIVYKRGKLNNS